VVAGRHAAMALGRDFGPLDEPDASGTPRHDVASAKDLLGSSFQVFLY
jgi:hypothetical protein